MDVDQIFAVLFGVGTGAMPAATMLFAFKELRTRGMTVAAVTAIGITGGWLGGESWASGRIAAFLFDQELGKWVIMGLSGVTGVSGVLGLIRLIRPMLE